MSVTVTDLHNAIIQAFKAQFTDRVETIATYRATSTDPINTPALLLEMEDASEGPDAGDERTPLRCRFTAHCMLSFQTPNVEIEVREFAAEVFRLIRHNLWGLSGSVKRPEQIEMGPGQFKPGKAGYESCYVTWEQVIYLGDTVWTNEGTVPTEVYVAYEPNTGEGGDYEAVE